MKCYFRFRKTLAGPFLVPILLCFLFPALILACKGKEAASSGSVDGRLTVIFMNDTHSHLYPWKDEQNGREYGGAARWATVIKNIREEADNTLFLHAGDMLVGSDGNYLTNAKPNWERLPGYGYRGLLDIPLFGMLGLDAAVFGNHEFDYGLYWNYHLFKDSPFDMLAANLAVRSSPAEGFDETPYFSPYKMYRKGPFIIGVIGLGTDEYIKTTQLEISDPAAAVSPLIEKLKKECDILIVLSHLGADKDEELAAKAPGIDVIVGGHSHTYLPQPRVAGGTIITQTGCWGEYVGRLDLEYREGKRAAYDYKLIPADFSVPEDPEIRSWLDERLYPLELAERLEAGGKGKNSLGDYLAAAVEEKHRAGETDMVLLKSGKYRGVLEAGPVSARDFFTVLWPYRNRGDGPEKDRNFGQLYAALVADPGDMVLRHFLGSSSGLTTLIRCRLPEKAIAELEAFVSGRSADYTLRKSGRSPADASSTVVMDLPSWIDLYRKGILTGDYQYESLEQEIIEVLLN
jgi:2',3'-cyclic-nucleotide 2'-phosphodiesterase (5'-nucleotidase family)